MVQMIIMMHFSINTMATGNKIIILCPKINKKMFPYTETLSCLLPVGNTNTLMKLLEDVSVYQKEDIVILGPSNAGLEKIADEKQARFEEMKENYVQQLYDEMQESEHAIIFYANTLWHVDDITKIMEVAQANQCGALIKEYDRYTPSINTFGVQADKLIENIFGHPREHYVNAQLCGAYVLTKEMLPYVKHCNRGFHNVNCGQMPDTEYYVEEAMQEAIEHGIQFHSIWSRNPFIKLSFPWDLAEANIIMCRSLERMHTNNLSSDTQIDASCQIEGFLETGKNVTIKDGVIIEGNCKIGNDVIIEKGAIIGKNCMIGDHSRIRYQCRISDETIIGPNNKIGYHAEVCGVTFDGVCAVHGCEVFGIIGNKVDIAAGVRMAILRFDDSFVTQHEQGKKYRNPYTNHIFIGDYCRTGVNNVFLPGVKVGSRSAIGPNVLVEKDIEANSLVLLKQETITKEWGSHRYGW